MPMFMELTLGRQHPLCASPFILSVPLFLFHTLDEHILRFLFPPQKCGSSSGNERLCSLPAVTLLVLCLHRGSFFSLMIVVPLSPSPPFGSPYPPPPTLLCKTSTFFLGNDHPLLFFDLTGPVYAFFPVWNCNTLSSLSPLCVPTNDGRSRKYQSYLYLLSFFYPQPETHNPTTQPLSSFPTPKVLKGREK